LDSEKAGRVGCGKVGRVGYSVSRTCWIEKKQDW